MNELPDPSSLPLGDQPLCGLLAKPLHEMSDAEILQLQATLKARTGHTATAKAAQRRGNAAANTNKKSKGPDLGQFGI